MNLVAYLESIEGLRAIDRTVSAQEVSPNDNGALRYNIFFPLTPVKSVKISEIIIGTFRPVASRREWNGPGRLIPQRAADTRDCEMLPIEAYFTIGEREKQSLVEVTDNNEQLMLSKIGGDLPMRADAMAAATWNTVERDAFQAWASGTVIQDDPQTGRTVETRLVDAARYDTAGTAWTGGDGGTAYNNFLAWLRSVSSDFAIGGVYLRLTTQQAIQSSAPKGLGNYLPTLADVTNRLQDEMGTAFKFVTDEGTLDVPLNGGLEYVSAKRWKDFRVAAIPADGKVGITAKAPNADAADLERAFPDARIDRNGVAVSYISINEGKGAKVAANQNTLALPNPRRVRVINAGI